MNITKHIITQNTAKQQYDTENVKYNITMKAYTGNTSKYN